jgi:hypothetical protein
MQIQSQSLNYLNAYNAISANSAKTDAAISTTGSTAKTTSSADVVSISSEAQQLLQTSQTSSSSASGSKYVLSADSNYKWLSDACHADPSTAAKYTHEFASNSSNDILYDGDSISNPPLRFAISKEVVTPESIEYFNQMKDKTTIGTCNAAPMCINPVSHAKHRNSSVIPMQIDTDPVYHKN